MTVTRRPAPWPWKHIATVCLALSPATWIQVAWKIYRGEPLPSAWEN